ncbi:MAG: exodeoxyribonuclease VII small subunit [Christensenellales bacterium]|jgi:exodeoxyribonuclease VII small subunit
MSEPLQFEEAIARLDELLAALEEGKIPLNQSLSYYEEGISLIKSCKEELVSAKTRIRILTPEEMDTGEIE